MGKAKKRITTIFVTVSVITIIVLMFYMDIFSRKQNQKKEASTEVEKILEKDFDANYPQTPREVAKTYSSMLKLLYSGIGDDNVEAVAKKILIFYDDEFKKKNPEETYLKDLYSEIAAWNKANRMITNYIFVNEDKEEKKEVDGKEYATVNVSYTIMEKGKTTEVRQYLLRKDSEGKWRILGWEIVPKEENQQ